jgi:hypothetical protein
MASNFKRIENREEWQGLLDKALFKTFFHSLKWETFLEEEFPWLKFERYVWLGQGVQAKALLSLANVNGKKLVSHPFCEYGGPLPLIGEIDGQELKRDLLAEFRVPFKISFHPYLLKYFKGLEREPSQRETYLLENIGSLDLDDIGDRNRHRQKQRAVESGLTVEACQTENDLQTLYNLYVQSLKKHKALVYPLSFFEFFFQNKADILLAKQGQKTVGGNIFLLYNGFVHSFLCGFEERYRNLGAHTLILWSELKQKQSTSSNAFDFGATRKDSSIGDFKSRWGATAYPIIELKNYQGESKLKDSFLRDVWSLLPAFLIKRLSPRLLKHKL